MGINQVLKNHLAWLIQEGIVSGPIPADTIAEKADLSGVNLSGVNLCRADLSYADLSGADLRGANLYGVNLYGANLSCADLRRANLSCADLRRADLSCAHLSGADLSGAKNIVCIGPMYTSGRMIYIVNGGIVMIQAGCFWGNVDELEKAIKESHNDSLYLAICEMIRGGKMFNN